MMAKMVRLVSDRPAAVAVGAANLALGDLSLEGCDRVFLEGEPDDAVSLGADVIEFEHEWVVLAAIGAGRHSQVLD